MQLFEFIQRAQQTNLPEWNYYHAHISVDPLVSPERSLDFIREYFQNGQKGGVIVDIGEQRDALVRNGRGVHFYEDQPLHLSEFRAAHIVSTFFLGIMLEQYLAQENAHVNISVGREIFPFSYLWFLTCLYHDQGYIVEENWVPRFELRRGAMRCPDSYRTMALRILAVLRRRLKITYCLPYLARDFQQREQGVRNRPYVLRRNMYNALLAYDPTLWEEMCYRGRRDRGRNLRFTYSRSLVERYFLYCIRELKPPVYNHGIVGGYLFYDRMVKNYIRAYEQSYPNDVRNGEMYPNITSFSWNGKHFFAEQLPIFAHIADCIISHNIWKAAPGAEEKYLQYGLEELVGENFRRISYRNNPLLFVLAIVDTLDPYKVYGSDMAGAKDAPQIWRTFDFSFCDGVLTVKSRYKCRPIQRLYNKAKSLEEWTDVKDVRYGDENSFSIKII